ncbi:ParM/StbA family protein [Alicyclobacillus acidoterrestris]|uniref:Uncharacterized protein n=1 Tax=Alicyclobacillus acidoterrestris (strain ATCC 49025 / DSM 3922 / CIP 106132 / NCIMB 13137 / GD3B) TaxID=1356854 RepID=T0DDD4_ALIAG|nr:hypothetical protein [Alicyclobacillus acidoterrestris]EPZ47666.1 hypothetical protein N007_05260 [Alicyclobacillus acidoterrestris ATCC 49025]UNO48017.1 hypothetical protein K1I37_15190 [Alicyclobacillus acidoterrestris]
MPECASCVYLLPSKSGIVHGIDLGGATTNYVTWENGKWMDLRSGTLPYGVLNKEMEFHDLARLIAFDLMKHMWGFNGPVYTMGGTAEILAVALREYGLKDVVSIEEGVYANAKSYYTVGRLLSKKLQTQR